MNPAAPSLNEQKSGWHQWLRQPHRLRLYSIVFHVHVAIGVVVGLYVGFMSLTGAVLVYGNELSTRIPIQPLVNLHSNLAAGNGGRLVNGVGAACLALLCLTGAFVWWPGISFWRHGLAVSWRSNFDRIVWDSHGALGFWSLPFLFVWAVSGAYFAYPDFFNAVLPADSLVLLWLADLHFGRFNWVTKTIWSLLALAPAGLAFTGVFICCRRVIFHKRSTRISSL